MSSSAAIRDSRASSIATASAGRWPALSLAIEPGEIFAFLGPNGGGKTTLFRLLSTLIPIQQGSDRDSRLRPAPARRKPCGSGIGVVFQAPSLDKKLTVAENLRHQGHLYGFPAAPLRAAAR